MAQITLCRIDDRLIHGQVIVKWSKSVPLDRILIVDDKFAKDPFMVSVYKTTIPKHLKLSLLTVEDSVKKWESGSFKKDNIMLLSRTVSTIDRLVEKGLPIESLNVGGIAAKPNSVVVTGTISITEDDASLLKKISEKNVDVYFQMIPEQMKESLKSVLDKNFSK